MFWITLTYQELKLTTSLTMVAQISPYRKLISGVDGNTTFTWQVAGVDPGQYVLRMQVQDDITSPKGSWRH